MSLPGRPSTAPAPSTRPSMANSNNKLTLERIIGTTANLNSAVCVNQVSGELAYIAGRLVVVYNPKRNRQVRFFRASKAVSCCTFSSDGKFLAVGEKGLEPAIIVFDTSSGAVLSELKAHKYGISCVSFSPNANVLVSCGFKHDRRMYIWNWRAARPVAAARISQKVNSLAFAGAKQFVTVGEKHVKFWNLDASNVIFPGQEPDPNAADMNESSYDPSEHSVLAANLPNPDTPLPEIKGFPASILASHATSSFVDVACHASTGKVFTVTSSGTLCTFDGKEQVMENWVSLENTEGLSIDVQSDSIAVGCSKGVVRLFDAKTLKYVTSLPLPPSLAAVNSSSLSAPASTATASKLPSSNCVRFLPGATKVAVIYSDNNLFMYDLTNPNSIGKYRSFIHHSGPIWDIQCIPLKASCSGAPPSPRDSSEIPEYSFVTTSADSTFRFWNLGVPGTARITHNRWKNIYSKDLIHCASHPTDEAFRSVAAHPDRGGIAVGDNKGRIMIFDVNSLSYSKLVNAHDSEVMSLDYSPSGLMASASRDKLVHVFDDKYSRITTLDNHTSTVNTVRFSAQGDKIISCGTDKSMHVSSVETSGGLTAVKKSSSVMLPNTIYDICPCDKFILSCQKSALNVHSQNGKIKRKYGGDGGDIFKLDVDRSGLVVATAGMDKWVRLFDFMSGEEIGKVAGHSELVTGVKFTLDNRRLISVGGDGCIFVWRLSPEITKAMEERLAEKENVRAAAENAKAAVSTTPSKELKAEQVPGWAKTIKTVEKHSTPDPVADNVWTRKKNAQSAEAPPPAEDPPPPPPPGEEDEKYEDDFEFDDDAVVIQKGGDVMEESEPNDELLRSSVSVVAPDDENVDFSMIEDEEGVTDPNMFYESIDENLGGMFEKFAAKGEMVREEEVVEEDDGDVDDDLVVYGDDTVDDSCYKEVMEDITNAKVGSAGDEEVRESLSKNFRRMRSESEDVEGDTDDTDTDADIDLSKLEESVANPEAMKSLKEEREAIKLKENKTDDDDKKPVLNEKKKKTEDAVELMRSKLSAMGFLSQEEINPNTLNLDKEIGLEKVLVDGGGVDDDKDKVVEDKVVEDKVVEVEADDTGDVDEDEDEDKEVEEAPPPPPPPAPAAPPQVAPLSVITELPVENGPSTKDSNVMFLSPATTASNKSLDETSLVGLSFAQTAKKEDVKEELKEEEEEEEKSGEESVSSDKSVPIPSNTSPSNSGELSQGDVDKENAKADANSLGAAKVPASPVKAAVHDDSSPKTGLLNSSVSSSIALRRPKEVYKKTLKDLNAAMKNAFDLYQELLEQTSSVNLSSNTLVLDESVATLEESEPVELLNSFRDSFTSLQGRMAVFNNTFREREDGGLRASRTHNNSAMPSILEDSAVSVGSLPPKPPSAETSGRLDQTRPVTAPAGGRTEAEVLDGVLEKHADILFAKISQRLMSQSQTLGLSQEEE